MTNENTGSQHGDGSLNVGVGDFRGATINVGGGKRSEGGEPRFTLEQLAVRRIAALGGASIKAERLSVFGIVTGLASLLGLYFTLYSPFAKQKYASWGSLFFFSMVIGAISWVLVVALRRRRFEPVSRRHFVELGAKGRIHLSTFAATCPWCHSHMNLRSVGPREGPRHNEFVCERNPTQHRILLDPTMLPEIDEERCEA
ncbi:hypothetical protein BTK96_004612 [Burkholderia pyrrocinia]|uniref:hypothetical protein n=1 Tax=Burkholderia sp. IT-111MI5 TaxID=3026439 RepID=UPI002A356D1E|nr:hypothetical protein [Burkholderia pyrrocinia]EKS9896099.1 hypothetical protein [Burkholderia pyrrocinia]EKS9909132.1 hypothetical protein [Burkholderia pyrrocinia]